MARLDSPSSGSQARYQAVPACLQGGRLDRLRTLRSERRTTCREGVERPGGYELWRTAGVAARMWGVMATVVALDAAPTTVLRSRRGLIIDARVAYPDVLHVEVRDLHGELWRLATQDAEWSPADPAQLVGRSIHDASIDEESGELRCELSDGS